MKCLSEMKERWRKGKVIGRWERERWEYFRGVEVPEGEEEEVDEEGLGEREREKQKEQRKERIGNSSYNRWYKYIKGEGIPMYLKKRWTEERWRRVCRYRMGNEVREGAYWESEEKRSCRMCGGEEETWEHVWERCVKGKEKEKGSWQEVVEGILGEEGEGEEWMKELDEMREGRVEGRSVEGEGEGGE